MRITLLLNWDSASAHALSLLKDDLDGFDVSVFYTRKTSGLNKTSGSNKAPSIKKTSSLKRASEFLSALARFDEQQLVKTQSIFDSFKAQELNDINKQGFASFAHTMPDLVISIRHMSILKADVINTPKHGVINLHSGMLPSYQGVMATFWAMKNKEANIGTTLHFIEDASIDTGAIIAVSPQATQFDLSYFDNMLSVYENGCYAIMQAVNTLHNGESLLSKPQVGEAQYYTYPTDHDFNEFEYALF